MKRHILCLVSQEDRSFILMLWQHVTVSQLAGSHWQCVCVVSCYLVVASEKMTKYLYLTAINLWLLVVVATLTDIHVYMHIHVSSTSRVYKRGVLYIYLYKMSEWLLFNAISGREQVNFQWDDEVRFVLDQHAELDFHSANSLKQHSADSNVAPLGRIILIHSQSVFTLSS